MAILSKGSLAPDFTLQADDGTTFTLSDHSGKAVVLFFYPKDDTPGCTLESIDFTQLQDQFTNANAVVAGISPDTVADHCTFRDKHDLAVPLLADPERVAIDLYGVWGEKTNFGKKYMGLKRSTFLITPGGSIAEAWGVSRVKGHAQNVLNAAQALML
jgi:peroxiredoxin Q/BCP